MQKGFAVSLIVVGIVLASSAQDPKDARVPDSATAIAIGRHAAIKVYGKKTIEYEEPLRAFLNDGIWTVGGTLCCPGRNGERNCEIGRCVGGVVAIKIRQSDGKILSMTHGK